MALTVKQRALVTGIVETGNVSEAGRRAGYANAQNAHRALTKNDEVMSALELALVNAGIDDVAVADALARLLNSENPKAVSSAIGHVIKIRGLEKPKKSLRVNVDYSDYAKTALNDDKAHTISPTQSGTTTTAGGVGVGLVPTVSLVK